MRILIGVVSSSIGGLNRFIANYILSSNENEFEVLKTGALDDSFKDILSYAKVHDIPDLMHPFKVYNRIKELCKQTKYDAVYINLSTNLFYPVLLAAKNSGVKDIIVHSHSSYSADEFIFKRLLIVLINNMLKKKSGKLLLQKKLVQIKQLTGFLEKNVILILCIIAYPKQNLNFH